MSQWKWVEEPPEPEPPVPPKPSGEDGRQFRTAGLVSLVFAVVPIPALFVLGWAGVRSLGGLEGLVVVVSFPIGALAGLVVLIAGAIARRRRDYAGRQRTMFRVGVALALMAVLSSFASAVLLVWAFGRDF